MDPFIHLALELLTLVILGSGLTLALWYLIKAVCHGLRSLF